MPRKPSQSLTDFANAQTLQDANDRLRQELRKERLRSERLFETIRNATADALAGIHLPPVKRPKLTAGKKGEEKALVCFSDLQLAKVTPTYNSEVAHERVKRYAEKIALLTNIARHDHPVKEARVYLGGDIIEGEQIFSHQPWQVDASMIRQVTDGAEMVAEFVRTLAAEFETVHCVGVIGNHGLLQGGKYSRFNPETNMDRMLYVLAQQILRDERRVTWTIPWEKNERSWYAVDYPFYPKGVDLPRGIHDAAAGPGFLIVHGDQIPGSASHSVATIAKHIYGWASGAVAEPFQYVLYGHWHNPRSFRFNKFRAWCNGSFESTNTYAQEKLAAVGHPEQWLLFANHQRVTAEYLVDLS